MKKVLFAVIILFVFVSNVQAFDIDMSKIDLNAKSKSIVNSFDLDYKIDSSKFDNSITNDRAATIYAENLIFKSFEKVSREEMKVNLFNYLYNDVDGNLASYTDVYLNQLFDNKINLGEIVDVKTVAFNEENVIVFVYVKDAKVNDNNKDIVLNYWLKYKKGQYSLYLPWITFSNEINEYFDRISYNEEKGNTIGYTYNQFDLDDNDNKVSEEALKNLFDFNKDSVVYISSMKDSTYTNGSGFFVRKGVIATSWSLFLEFLNNGDYLYINDCYGNTYDILGVVAADPTYDVVLLKVDEEVGQEVKFGNSNELYANANLFVINSKNNSGFSINYGVNVSYKNGKLKNLLPVSNSDVGSALFNKYGEVVGFSVRDKINSELSYANSTDYLKKVQNRLKQNKYDNIKYTSVDEFKEKYYSTLDKERKYNKISNEDWEQYRDIGSIETKIELELLKASYKDNIVSLRFANNAKGMLDSIYLASGFTEELLNQGYKLTYYNEQKTIYKNDEYQVILKDNFDYLIIIIMEI